ncbi:hypothetical protein [Paenibacillus turpanensis]|uniref:hypothetical protein n=1 Tax=Paenibacillus turpanensis TaxID=2689078 RepID=UPI00140836B3|nr:hypothetical protein [Paenibacillus turpanensis]
MEALQIKRTPQLWYSVSITSLILVTLLFNWTDSITKELHISLQDGEKTPSLVKATIDIKITKSLIFPDQLEGSITLGNESYQVTNNSRMDVNLKDSIWDHLNLQERFNIIKKFTNTEYKIYSIGYDSITNQVERRLMLVISKDFETFSGWIQINYKDYFMENAK